MPVWADDEGLVHLWAAPQSASDTYTLDCNESGTSVPYHFDLSDRATFVPAIARAKATDRKVRPALADPTSMSQGELARAGYGLRPDPSSPLYAVWLEGVSKPVTLITPPGVERPDLSFDPESYTTDARWCGPSLSNSFTHFSGVIAAFTTPTSFFYNGSGSETAFWTGVGGLNRTQLIQDGVDQKWINNVGTLQAWWEWVGVAGPFFPAGWVIAPGDNVAFWAWECDAYNNLVQGGGHACFMWQDNTNPHPTAFTWNQSTTQFHNTFPGFGCEAITERQPNQPLAGWSPWLNMEFDCADGSGGWHNLDTDQFLNFTMINPSNNHTLCASEKTGPDTAVYGYIQGL